VVRHDGTQTAKPELGKLGQHLALVGDAEPSTWSKAEMRSVARYTAVPNSYRSLTFPVRSVGGVERSVENGRGELRNMMSSCRRKVRILQGPPSCTTTTYRAV